MKKSKKIKLDNFHYDEVLGRIVMITSMLDNFVSETPAVAFHKQVYRLVESAGKNLAKSYQLISEIRSDGKTIPARCIINALNNNNISYETATGILREGLVYDEKYGIYREQQQLADKIKEETCD